MSFTSILTTPIRIGSSAADLARAVGSDLVGTGARGVEATARSVTGTGLLEHTRQSAGTLARSLTGALSEAVGGAPARRISRQGDDYWIEVRGLEHQFDALAAELRNHLEPIAGVTTVHINGPLSRALVTVTQIGTRRPGEQRLVDAVTAAEEAVRRIDPAVGEPRRDPVPLPGDDAPLLAGLLGTGLAAAGTAASVITGLVPGLRGPRLLAASVAVLDYHPAVRARLLGPLSGPGSDLLLRALAATATGVTGAPAAALVNTGLGIVGTSAALAGRRSWDRTGATLSARAHDDGDVPVPPGGLHRPPSAATGFESTSMNAGLLGGAAVGLAGTVQQGADAVIVGAPKAVRSSRETFATMLGNRLADRHGAVVLHPDALRSLSGIDTLLVDPRTLFSTELRVSRVTGTSPADRTAAWRAADEALAAGRLSTGWNTVAHAGTESRVLVSPVREELATPLLMEARRIGLRVVSPAFEGYGSLHRAFDRLEPSGDDTDADLARIARTLAGEASSVLLLTSSGTAAPTACPVSVGLLDGAGTAWNADLLVPDLAGAWRVLHAIPQAREAARRGRNLSLSGSVLGTLMLIPDVPGEGPGAVNSSALYGFWAGYSTARRVFDDPAPNPEPDYDWHAMPTSEVARRLPRPERPEERPGGLADSELIRKRLASVNRMRDYVTDFVATMKEDLADPITPILSTGAAASALLGSPVDAAMVGGVLALNTAISAQQSLHAERLLTSMLTEQDPLARLISGISDRTEYQEVRATALLPGDIIEVRSGEVVPADGRIIDVDNTEVDESALTGESLPVTKNCDDTPGAPLAERSGMLHAGTTMVAGRARVIVTATGAATAASRALALSPAPSREVGLSAQLGAITRRALPWSLTGAGIVGLLSLLRRTPIRDTASSTVSISVAAVPEGLPLVVTLAQSASARRLAGSAVLVRNPRAIEAFARLGAVCFDKTGTLSQNKLEVVAVHPLDGFGEDDVLQAAGQTMLVRRDGTVEHSTDAAIHEAALAADIEFTAPDALLPFQSERPYAAALDGRRLVIKGAPEALEPALKADQRGILHEALTDMASRGLRVLAVAEREVTQRQAETARADSARLEKPAGSGLRLLGLIGLADTPRPGAGPLITDLVDRGMQVRIITGDHPVTAAAIATEMGLECTVAEVMTGDVWDLLSGEQRVRAVGGHKVFARMSPEHKVQVVQALEDSGVVTAMVGDGANDAAAIRAASVGIGVVSAGSDPARMAADVMLLDGRIDGMLEALEEGEQLWRRVLSAVSVLLGHNIGELSFGLITTLITGRPALNARQMLLVNMLTDALPAAALAVSPQLEPEVDGAHDESTIWRAVAVRGAFTTLGATLAWSLARLTGSGARASTIGLIGLVVTQMIETLSDSHGPLVVATNLGTFAVMALLISIPGVSQIFGCTPVGPVGWAQAIGAAGAAAGVTKLLPGLVDTIADAISGLLVDGEEADADEDAVDVLDGGREDPGAGVDDGLRAESAGEIRHG